MDQFSYLYTIVLYIIPILFAITVHEVAHGWVASKQGDQTAKILGRLTLNPLKHIDLLGTVILPGLLIFLHAPFLFGWAKPVPVNANQLRHPRRDMAIVAAAGPLSNLLMALIWAIVLKFGQIIAQNHTSVLSDSISMMGEIGVKINIVLMVLNFIPIPPLDGSKVFASLLSPRAEMSYRRIEPYSFFILIALLASGILWQIMGPFINFFLDLFSSLFGF